MLAHRSHTAGQLNADGGRAGCPQAGEQEILVKWSWTMNFWWNRYAPLKFLWDPRLVFTGLTVLGYNRDTGAWRSGCCPVCSMLHSERQRPRFVFEYSAGHHPRDSKSCSTLCGPCKCNGATRTPWLTVVGRLHRVRRPADRRQVEQARRRLGRGREQ